jgi:hypothetical protein
MSYRGHREESSSGIVVLMILNTLNREIEEIRLLGLVKSVMFYTSIGHAMTYCE